MKKLLLFMLVFGFGVAIFGLMARFGINRLSAQEVEIPSSASELAWEDTEIGYGRCHGYRIDITSYEWLYAHLSEEDQLTVDLEYLDLILEIDFDPLTNEERLEAIDNLKDELIIFIEESEFEVGAWR